MNPLPYNITLSSQTASILYLPSRDGDLTKGWNTSYSDGVKDLGSGYPQGIGADIHRTSAAAATMELNWTGTAVCLYGDAIPGSYTIFVDNVDIDASTQSVTGLLGCQSDLEYKVHNVKLQVVGGHEVAFQYAELTIGAGYPGTDISNYTIQAVIGSNPVLPNEYFNFTDGNNSSAGTRNWFVEELKNGSRAVPTNYQTLIPSRRSST
ncbi:hypothetical protein VKT23_012543 [Stygiomarasmius scandens]|uniref:PA14 domain-containing protein n=1 Tax=Marasmiellus scandens TaxID=2682957 RepID=A0ABR1JA37_9AGAR